MKPNIRSRRVVMESVKHEPPKHGAIKPPDAQDKGLINPSRFPKSRIILRRQRKDEQQEPKVIKTQNQKESEDDHLSQNHTEIVSTNHNKNEQDSESAPVEFLEARDRRTVIKYDFTQKKYRLDRQKNKLNQWLGQMHFKVVSSSFNLYITKELTFQEVKVHCCENLLLNILIFLQHLTKTQDNQNSSFSLVSSSFKSKLKIEPLSHLQLTEILKEMNQTLIKNLAYMQIKYPLTKDTKPNKSLQSLIYKINNLGNDEHDMVMKSGVEFKLKNQDNYTPEIMKFLNFIINKQSEPCKVKGRQNKELTYFQFFYQTMETIFTSIYRPQYEQSSKNEKPVSHQYIDAVNLFANIMSNKQIKDEDEEVLSKEAKEYKDKVMKYTHYLIGCKISPNTQLYSSKEIQTQIFDVRNSSILRILTKWTEQLQKKIVQSEENILKRPFRFKKNKPYEYSKLNANQKNDLYQETKRRAKDVKLFNEQLQENYNQIESMISSHLDQTQQMKNIPRKQYKVGYFCSKIQVAASSTLLSYLNKMIHILLMIPEELKKNHILDEEYTDNIDINLITFKIADLFRCKIKSKEAEIIRIFKKIKQISEKGEPFKIVRIKDRLNLGTRDILINVLFMNIFLCEIQLAVEEYVDSKQVSYDSFSHFLYELHRSRLGPIMQSACTWAQFDQRSKIFRNLTVDKSQEVTKFVPHYCEKQYIVPNRYPFICSLCERFYSTQQGLLKHVKCNLCRTYFECTQCIYSKLTPEEISKIVNLPDKLGIFIDDFKLWSYQQSAATFPKFGLITSKNVKKPDIKFFQTVIFKYNAYLINIVEDQDHLGSFKLEIIQKIGGNSAKNWKKVEEKYIMYEWKEKRNFNKTVTPEVIVKAMEEEKKKKEREAKAKKEEKERRRQELEAKRRERDQEDSDDQKKKKKKHHKDSDSDSDSDTQKNVTSKNIENQKKVVVYHQTVAKKTNYFKVRVIQKETAKSIEIFVLGVFLKQSTLRNRLKEMSNKNILHRINIQKIEVLFFQDEYIHNEINEDAGMTETQKQELKETVERVSQVYLDNNFLERIDFISMMKALKVVHLSNNMIKSLDPLLELSTLTELIMENNEISNLQGLKNKPEITQINLNRNKLTDLTFFSQCQEGQFSHLKNFFLSGNQIQQLTGLEKLPSLVRLDLSYNKIQKIGGIKTLINLEQLDISSNKLKKVKGVQNFHNLKKLYLSENKIKKISKQISQLIFLQTLDLSENKLKKIENLNQGAISKNLRHLNLSDNAISVMEGLDGMENLISLNLSHNNIKQIDNYLDLNSLVKFDISQNCLQEVDLEDAEKYLPCLKQVFINSNPLLNNDFNRNVIAALSKHVQVIKLNLKEEEYEME